MKTKRGTNPGLAEKVRELREALGFTQGQLALKTGLSVSYISKMETGQVGRPSAKTMLTLAKGLRVDENVLYQAAGYSREEQRLPKDPLLRTAFMRAEEELDPEDAATIREIINDFVARKRRERAARRNHGTK